MTGIAPRTKRAWIEEAQKGHTHAATVRAVDAPAVAAPASRMRLCFHASTSVIHPHNHRRVGRGGWQGLVFTGMAIGSRIWFGFGWSRWRIPWMVIAALSLCFFLLSLSNNCSLSHFDCCPYILLLSLFLSFLFFLLVSPLSFHILFQGSASGPWYNETKAYWVETSEQEATDRPRHFHYCHDDLVEDMPWACNSVKGGERDGLDMAIYARASCVRAKQSKASKQTCTTERWETRRTDQTSGPVGPATQDRHMKYRALNGIDSQRMRIPPTPCLVPGDYSMSRREGPRGNGFSWAKRLWPFLCFAPPLFFSPLSHCMQFYAP